MDAERAAAEDTAEDSWISAPWFGPGRLSARAAGAVGAADAGDESASEAAAATGQQLSPADAERLQRLLTEFPATPVFARTLAAWTGPAAGIVADDVPRYGSRAELSAPETVDTWSTPSGAAAAVDDSRAESQAFTTVVSGGVQCTVVTALGEIRAETVGQLSTAVWQALGESPAQLVVDLRGVTQFDADGLRALLELSHAAADLATDFRLRGASDAVRAVIEAMSAYSAFQIDEDEDANKDAPDRSAPWTPPGVDGPAPRSQQAVAGRQWG